MGNNKVGRGRPRTLIAVLGPVILGGCSLTQPPNVPGMTNNVASLDPISVPYVLASLKCQVTEGVLEIKRLKTTDRFKTHPHVKDFNFNKTGSGTLSVKVTSVETNGATINAVVPFTGFTGTNATPSAGGSLSSTGVTELKRTFQITPTAAAIDRDLCKHLRTNQIDVGVFLRNAIVAAFSDTMLVPLRTLKKDQKPTAPKEGKKPVPPLKKGDRVAFNPALRTKQFDFTVSFAAVQKKEGGFALKIVPAGPRLDSVGPETTLNSDRTDVHTLTLQLPLDTNSTSDTRRIHYCVKNHPKWLCVEESFADNLWDARQVQLSNDESLQVLLDRIAQKDPATLTDEEKRIVLAAKTLGIKPTPSTNPRFSLELLGSGFLDFMAVPQTNGRVGNGAAAAPPDGTPDEEREPDPSAYFAPPQPGVIY